MEYIIQQIKKDQRCFLHKNKEKRQVIKKSGELLQTNLRIEYEEELFERYFFENYLIL